MHRSGGKPRRRPPRFSTPPPTAGLGFLRLLGLGFPRTCCSPRAPLSRPSRTDYSKGSAARERPSSGRRAADWEEALRPHLSGAPRQRVGGGGGGTPARQRRSPPRTAARPQRRGRPEEQRPLAAGGAPAVGQGVRGASANKVCPPAGRAGQGPVSRGAGQSGRSRGRRAACAGRELTCHEDRLQEAEVALAVLLGNPHALQGHGHVHLQRDGLGGRHERAAVRARGQARGPAARHGGPGRRGLERVPDRRCGRVQVGPGAGRRHPRAGVRDGTPELRPASAPAQPGRTGGVLPPATLGPAAPPPGPARPSPRWGPRRRRPERARPEPGNLLGVRGSGALPLVAAAARATPPGCAHTPPLSSGEAERRRGRRRRDSSSLKGEPLQRRPLSGEGRLG